MSTALAQSPSVSLSIELSDLSSVSQLKKLIQGNARPVFDFGAAVAPYWNSAVQTIPNGTTADIAVSGSGNWKTTTGIGFGLSGSAKCQLKVVTSGSVFSYAPDLKSQPTAKLPTAPYNGSAYIVLSLDFQISGTVSGSGNISGIGIGGKAMGSADASVTFCHLIDGTSTLSAAIEEAFDRFVFPFEPGCSADMGIGDIATVNFHGTLGCSLDVSYGITDISFAAPGVASALSSATQGSAQFTLPAGKVEIGAKASVSYTHEDDFTAIVQRSTANTAFLYVMRARKNDGSEAITVSATVNITNTPGVTIDSQKLQQAIDGISGVGGAQAAAAAADLAQGLTNKLNGWIKSVNQGASLGAEWDQHQAASALFKYNINLNDGTSVGRSWTDLCTGDLRRAVADGGLIPLPGSGISTQLSTSFTIKLQFFNLFSATSKTTYFNNTYVVVTQSGDLRYMYDIGKEAEVDVQKSKRVCRIHFVVTIDQTSAGNLSSTDVDLELELTATNNQAEAGHIGDVVGLIPPNQLVNQAQKAMQQFVTNNPSGTLNLVCILKPSAYGRLSCSEYIGNNPPMNQQQDSENWLAFQGACSGLLNLRYAAGLRYSDWQAFNRLCVYDEDTGTADRRHSGNPFNVPPSFWGNNRDISEHVSYFLGNSAAFMNLCDDLHQLAGLATNTSTAMQDIRRYNDVLITLVGFIVSKDINIDFSKPAIAAILRLSNAKDIVAKSEASPGSYTCTVTIS